MSIIYMQIWLFGKDFPGGHWVPFPAGSEGDCPSASLSLSLSILEKVAQLDLIAPLLATLPWGLLS